MCKYVGVARLLWYVHYTGDDEIQLRWVYLKSGIRYNRAEAYRPGGCGVVIIFIGYNSSARRISSYICNPPVSPPSPSGGARIANNQQMHEGRICYICCICYATGAFTLILKGLGLGLQSCCTLYLRNTRSDQKRAPEVSRHTHAPRVL